MARCALCGAKAQYQDRHSGQYVCPAHARLEVVAAARRPQQPPLTIRRVTAVDRHRVAELALYFWDETEVECFGRSYDVLTCPAFLACGGEEAVGLAAYSVEAGLDAVVLVMLNLLPAYQGRGGGGALVDAVLDEAARLGQARVLVATSNDDLPALAVYQRHGFHLAELIPDGIANHHGGELVGLAGIPIRDEIRLERLVSSALPPPAFISGA